MRPANKYIILYCHGGGYSAGSSVYARTLTSKLAMSTSMDVLSFDYRLAPENPYSAAVEDAVKVWDYLMLLGYGARDIIVVGDSAGGNLALALVHKLNILICYTLLFYNFLKYQFLFLFHPIC